VLAASANALGVVTIEGRWRLPHSRVPEPVLVPAANDKPLRRGYPRGARSRARALLCARFTDGPKPGAAIEAEAATLAIPVRLLLRAADELGVRTRRGEWWLPV
jgi:hypothetical protein